MDQFEAAKGGAEAIRAFAAAGGKFTDQQDNDGWTAGIYAAWNGPRTIRAFAAAGGKFTDEQNKYGITAAMYAAKSGAKAVATLEAAFQQQAVEELRARFAGRAERSVAGLKPGIAVLRPL